MGLFSKNSAASNGGIMNVIRCDEPEYLVWKWRPAGQELGASSRENSIRWGSSLRVKDGEVAVFVYHQKDGPMQDFIVGPFDQIIKTENFPVLSSIVGAAFGGGSPFQAEVYFINLAKVIQLKFVVPYFDVQDPRFPNLSIPLAMGGTISFKIDDYREFLKIHRLVNFTLADLEKQIKDTVVRRVKGLMTNILYQLNTPLVQIERHIDMVSDFLKDKLKEDLIEFGVALNRLDVSRIDPDKEDPNWAKLQKVTAEYTVKSVEINQDNALNTAQAQADLNLDNMARMQELNAQHMEEMLRIQREESQYAQHLQSQQANLGAFQIGQQTDVLKTAAGNMGQMGTVNFGGGDGGFNPAGAMTGMMMGGALGQQMAGMMNNMGNAFNGQMQQQQNSAPVPPPIPQQTQYMAVINGNQAGPFNMQQLQQLAAQGQLTLQTYVWKQGMANWELAGNVTELAQLFMSTPPPVPGGVPPVPPTI